MTLRLFGLTLELRREPAAPACARCGRSLRWGLHGVLWGFEFCKARKPSQ
jgi:hypothetical protein